MGLKYLKYYQDLVNEWAQHFKSPYCSPLSQMANMTEEVGELARAINHVYGDKPKKSPEEKSEIAEEIGDIIFTAICISNNLGIDLDEALRKTLEKYKIRDKDKHEKKN